MRADLKRYPPLLLRQSLPHVWLRLLPPSMSTAVDEGAVRDTCEGISQSISSAHASIALSRLVRAAASAQQEASDAAFIPVIERARGGPTVPEYAALLSALRAWSSETLSLRTHCCIVRGRRRLQRARRVRLYPASPPLPLLFSPCMTGL